MKGVNDTFAVQSEVDVDVDDVGVNVKKPSVNNRRCHRILSTFVYTIYFIRGTLHSRLTN